MSKANGKVYLTYYPCGQKNATAGKQLQLIQPKLYVQHGKQQQQQLTALLDKNTSNRTEWGQNWVVIHIADLSS